ncbi:tyrosine-type recombinase/integrase [Vagococcus sp. BWB3-3]|uniref:Tyrosine-type recombinase/integrase n=1 Tax=Vagococcus allomyrinae TaxID=2794353 RepID=A0A940STK8_9ENTE|nr:tyrosine-type recombinase/integrase [Vagococcus allomyrinae]MBP1040395.1 tyrosine-type recombinase/integrase [Vagococcus allomyrinae]
MIIEYDKYSQHLKRNESAKGTARGYMTNLRQLENFAISNGYQELSFDLMVDYKRYMMEEMRYLDSTTNQKITVFSTYFNFIETIDMNFKASDYKIKKIKRQNKRSREFLVPDEYEALVMVCPHPETRMLMKFTAFTGLRISEATNLTLAEIEPEEIEITNKGKTRIIGAPDWLKDELREFFKGRDADKPMFSFSQTTYRNRMKQAARICGVKEKKVYPHAFRHYFAKEFLRTTQDQRALSMLKDILGHSDLKTTMGYLQYNPSEIVNVMKTRGTRDEEMDKRSVAIS